MCCIYTLFHDIDAGIQTQEVNETEILKETNEAEAVEVETTISGVPDDVSSEMTSSNGSGTTNGDDEMLQLGCKWKAEGAVQ